MFFFIFRVSNKLVKQAAQSNAINTTKAIQSINGISLQSVRTLSVVQGDLKQLAPSVRKYVEEKAKICQPENIHICDGTEQENNKLLQMLQREGVIKPLPKYDNWWEVN